MAVDFPDSPSNGDTTTINGVVYTYNSTKTAWETLESVDASVALSDNPPSNPNNGDLWFNSASGELLVRYNDGTSSQWVGVSGPAGASASLSAVAEDILPDADSSRSLGSPTKKWKDLYLSGSTIHLGDSATLSAAPGGEIVLPSLKIGTGSNAVKLEANSSGELETRAVVGGTTQAAKPAGGTTQVATLAAMQAIVNPSIGDLCSVTANNTIYMYNGTGFYKIATMVNESPSAITGVDGAYSLATDGTATTITANSSDPEGRILNWSYAVSSGSLTNGGGTTATIAQGTGVNTNVFTITPTTNSAYAGPFSITFNVTDNVNGAVSAVSSFTLSFVVTNSRYTSLSVKATNTGSNQTFDDASTSNHTITASEGVTASTFSPYRHGGYSLKFENSASDDKNITFNNISGAGQVETTGAFCVEMWVKFTVSTPAASNANARIFASDGSASTGGNAAWNLQIFPVYGNNFTGAISLYTNTHIYQADGAASASEIINDGQWHHLAVTRDSSYNLRFFSDGSLVTTVTNTQNFKFRETRLGKRDGGTGNTCFTGEMRDIRIVIGSSVYESAFTPPTEPLTAITNTYLLVGDLPYVKDESTNNFSVYTTTYNNQSTALPVKFPISLFDNSPYSEAAHGASAHFDGTTGNRLTIPHHADFDFSGDYVIEFWFNSTNSNYTYIFAKDEAANSNNFQLYTDTGTKKLSLWISDGATSGNPNIVYWGNLGPVASNTGWHHFCLVRNNSAGTYVSYINGAVVNTTSSAVNSTSTQDFFLGGVSGSNNNFKGHISDFKFLTAIPSDRNAAFTLPTAPSVADSNTKFLLNPETSISDLSQRNALICRGDLETSTTQVKFAGTKSIYLDGTGDFLQSSESVNIAGDWTIEGWYYFTTLTGPHSFFTIGDSASLANSMEFLLHTTGELRFYNMGGGYSNQHTPPSDFLVNNWIHIAVVRSGTGTNNIKAYINGTQSGTGHTSNNDLIGKVNIGTELYNGAGTWFTQGYIQDFRVSSIARYTANFTPPTAELQG